MATRGQVKIGNVYLYQHLDAGDLENTVRRVLKRGLRWHDPCYLARMVFCAMVPVDNWRGETGFGIDTEEHYDIEYLITLDTKAQTVNINGVTVSFIDFIDGC